MQVILLCVGVHIPPELLVYTGAVEREEASKPYGALLYFGGWIKGAVPCMVIVDCAV